MYSTKAAPKQTQNYLELGHTELKQGKLQSAIEHYRMAVKQNPKGQAWGNLAEALEKDGQIEGALLAYEKAVANRAHAPFCFKVAQLYEQFGEMDQAMTKYQQALEVNPNFAPALSQLMKIYEGRKDFSLLRSVLQKIVQIQPNNHSAWLKLATTLRELGERQAADIAYKTAVTARFAAGIVNRTTVVQSIIDRIIAKTYLEIGVCTGVNFLQIQAPHKIAVDPQFRLPGGYKVDTIGEFYELSSDDFFAQQAAHLRQSGLDVVLIDGLHTYEQSLQDVLHALDYLNPGGVIVLHDCLPPNEAAAQPSMAEAQKLPSWNRLWTGNVWKTIVHLRSLHPDLNTCVLNCDHGIGLVIKGESESLLPYSKPGIDRLTYQDLEENKVQLLNLKEPSYFQQFLSQLSSTMLFPS